MLMRAAERELAEIERKKQVADTMKDKKEEKKEPEVSNRQKLETLLVDIKAESTRLANLRAEMSKLKQEKTAAGGDDKKSDDGGENGTSGKKTKSKSGSSSEKPEKGLPKNVARPIPNGVVPELAQLVAESGAEGVSKITEKFIVDHPGLAKRQIDIKINEVAVKEKRDGDSRPVWYINPEWEEYLELENFETDEGEPIPGRKRPSGSTASGKGGSEKKKGKRKADVDPEDDDMPSGKKSKASSSKDAIPTTEPKKPKRAFNFFVRDKRSVAEDLVDDPDNTEELREKLKEMWVNLDRPARDDYFMKEKEDQARYDREMELWETKGAEAPPSKKKAKA
jgi:hypothetical protein